MSEAQVNWRKIAITLIDRGSECNRLFSSMSLRCSKIRIP
jgi:hypothetical protein